MLQLVCGSERLMLAFLLLLLHHNNIVGFGTLFRCLTCDWWKAWDVSGWPFGKQYGLYAHTGCS